MPHSSDTSMDASMAEAEGSFCTAMCSGRTPRITSALCCPFPASLALISPSSGKLAPAYSTE